MVPNLYNLNETKTPAGKGQHLAHLTANPERMLDRHLKNLAKLEAIVPQTRTEAKHLEGQLWMCRDKVAYWTRRATKKALA